MELKPGEIICPKCNGEGEVLPPPPAGEHWGSRGCANCLGRGKLDWIERIMGVRGTSISPGVYVNE